jgi:hypothetical protein
MRELFAGTTIVVSSFALAWAIIGIAFWFTGV